MYLRVLKDKSGKRRLVIYESYWSDGRSKSRTVETLGFFEDLEAKHDDPIAWGKQVAEEKTEQKKAQEQKTAVDIYPLQKIDKHTVTRKNIGSAALLGIYNALKIPQALRSAIRGLKVSYNLDSIVRLLVCERILYPGSKLCAWHNKQRYFFKSSFSDDDVYRALDVLAKVKNTVVSTMNRTIQNANIRNLEAVYYDVTNYYFEIDKEDDLRKKGVSKEHRKSPIVQMGLLQDVNGIPISYQLFAGNTSDSQTMIPVLSDLKRDNNLDRVIVVADKGLNCSQNIAACVGKGDGFVFSQSIKGTKSDSSLRKWVLDQSDYNVQEDSKMKSMQGSKTVHLKPQDCDCGKAKDVKVDVKYVAKWSAKYEERARKKRQETIEKAEQLIKNPGAYTRATSYGAARYVEDLHFDKETGEILTDSKLKLNEKAIEQDKALDGYYLIVTSEVDWSDEKICNAYHELWQIEETFKITKSEIKTRPVYVYKRSHIEAHFLTCYISLVILRLLQFKTGLKPAKLKEELAAMCGTNIADNWWVFDHRSDESDIIADTLELQDLKLQNLKTLDVRKLLGKAAKIKF